MKANFTAINKAVGAELEEADGGIFLNEEQIEKVNAALVKGESDAASLETVTAEKEKTEEDLQAANNTIKQKDEAIAAKDQEIADLKKNAGAETAKVVSKKETVQEKGEKDENVTSDEKSFFENLEAVSELLN